MKCLIFTSWMFNFQRVECEVYARFVSLINLFIECRMYNTTDKVKCAHIIIQKIPTLIELYHERSTSSEFTLI